MKAGQLREKLLVGRFALTKGVLAFPAIGTKLA
jgi:hypothetical protein